MSVKRYDYGYQDGYSADGMTGLQFDDDGALVEYDDYAALEARCLKLAAENAGLKKFITQECNVAHVEPETFYEEEITRYVNADGYEPETPATDAFLAEVRAHDLNAFIRHHSAELDAHIKNGGEQFDEKSVRIRDIIVSARLFREQLRQEAAQ